MSPTTASFPRGASRTLVAALFGTLFGLVVSRTGFTSYDEVHKMFTFADLRLFLIFCIGVGVTGAGLFLTRRKSALPPRFFHKGSIVGGVIFGVGWAVAGACPGVMAAQIGEGQLPALISIAGAAVGTIAYRLVHARFFRWDRGSCG